MPDIREIAPELLRERHRFSVQQINKIFGRNVLTETLEDRLSILNKIAEFIAIADAFSLSEIPFIPLKGPILSERLYNYATWRHFNDLDILVDVDLVEKSVKTLGSLKFIPESIPWPDTDRQKKQLLKFAHYLAYYNPATNTKVELHWQLFKNSYIGIIEQRAIIYQNLTYSVLAGRQFTVMNKELELLYLIIHGGLHQWGRLKWLEDIRTFLCSQGIKWVYFNELVTKFKADRKVALCNAMLEEYYPGDAIIPGRYEAPRYMIRASRKRVIDIDYPGKLTLRSAISYIYYTMISHPGLAYKINALKIIVGYSFKYGRISRLLRTEA